MLTIKRSPQFDIWLSSIKDSMVRIRLNRRIDRLSVGLLGDYASVGDGVFELREHFGAGWRLYYTQRGDAVVLMLGGGTKSTQRRDIATAIELSKRIED
jgi:putative addiction module killer protein